MNIYLEEMDEKEQNIRKLDTELRHHLDLRALVEAQNQKDMPSFQEELKGDNSPLSPSLPQKSVAEKIKHNPNSEISDQKHFL